MKNVSNEFKNIIKSGGPFYAYASITLKNGEKLYLDSDNDFFISGNGYAEDGGDGFPLGSALSKSVTLVIDNIDERFSKYDFYYAQISLFTEADIESRSYDAWRDVKGEEILDVNGNMIMLTKSRIERLNEGTFTVLEPTAVGDTIELVGYDSMYKADADFTSKLSYPTTAGQLLREACSTCNIMLGSPKFNNDDFVIEQAPEKVTCREVIGYIAMLSIGNAVIQNGTLVIKSYDFSAISKITNRDDLVEDAGYSILMDYQSDPDISTDPVVITGIATTKKVENESTILIRGTDDYALEITNPLIEGHEDDAINLIGDVLIGVKLRGFSGEFFPDPTIEFMDLACVVDRKDKVYPTFITSHEFSYLGSSSFSCGIKDPERQKSTYYSEAKKVYEKANKEIKQNKTDFEAAVENLNKTLENASGMYSTESPQPDGSMITYIHDKPTVEESKNVIKVTSEAIGISNDGGKTYPYGLFLTGDLITRILYAIGINADYINSGSLTVKDKDGNITFYADTETGRVTINAESISITGKSVEDISNGIVDDFVTNIYKNDIDEIKESVRNKIETWYQDSDPSVNWIVKIDHEGDLWKDTRDNKEYIYRSGQWEEMNVPDEVFDEIDSKAQIFINEPTTPYKIGDLWFESETKELLTCIKSRATGSCVKADWEKRTKYTDDSTVNTFITKIYESDIDDIRNQIDQKIETWYQSTDPSVNWGGTVEMAWCDVNGESILDVNGNEIILLYEESKAEHEGDLWKDLSTNDEYIYRGGQWMKMQVPDEVFDEIDGKAQIFINTPVPPYRVGDLWFDADTQELLTCVESRDKGSCVKSDWQKKTKYTDDSGLNTFISAVYDPKIAELQSQIDGQIETWFYDHEPSLQNEPAVNWTTNEQRKDHEGDLFFWKSTGYSYRFLQDGAVWKWQIVQDTDISKALAAAEKAQDTADHKRRVFVVTPQPPYDIGDLWVQGDDGDIMRCCVARSESASFSASDWEKASKYTDDTRANEVQKELETVNKDLQNQIDGKIETYNQSADPAASWTTAELKAKHTGDLWYNSKTEETMRWNGSAWSKLSDADAKAAKNLAVTKKRVFSVTPYPPYDTDDLWVQGTNGDLMRCVTSRQSGEYVASDWVKATKYTDDSTVTDFIENIYDPKIEDIQNQIDGKIDTYYYDYEPANSNHPASEWTTAYERQKHVGDLFFWKNKGFTYRYMKVDTSYQWVRVKDADIVSAMETASKAQDTADGKRRNFITTPVPPYDVGDLWTQGDTGDLMRCKTARASGNYVSSDWTKATKYTDDSAVEKLNKSLTSEEVFNRLTDNGKKQGIYMQGDQLYINFSYGKGGTLTLGGVNNENGSIQILDAIGAEVGKWDKDGLNIKKGSIYGSTIYLDKEKAHALIVGRNNSKEIFTIGSMGMHIDNTNMGLLASDSMVVDLMGGWFHGLRMKASNNGRGYGSSISPESFSIGWAEDLQGWSDAMSEVKSYTFSISENSTGCLSIRINGSSYINDYVDISPREIKTTGTKNRVVPTENYSNRLQYCYETASPMFGDIGEGITDENGECIVEIGDIFTETVTTRIEYQVFLQKEGKGDLWIEKKEENYFIVHGTPNLKFAWELKAKQKDYEYVNLEEDVDREEKLPESPENILNAELETLIKEQEELLNETA